MITVPYQHRLHVFSFKSRAWQLGLTAILWCFTFLLSLTTFVSEFEYDLFQYILELQPVSRDSVAEQSIRFAPQWSLLLIYGLILAIYVRRYTRSPTTVLSILNVILILFALLMLEVVFAVFPRVFLPIMFPALVMLLASMIYWGIDLYHGLATSLLLEQEPVDLSDVRERIDGGDLRTALTLLKQCPYSDEMLEVGYELGMLLESSKHWASALNLYHWLSRYDPGLNDFVTRIEDIRKNRAILLKLGKTLRIAEPELPMIGNYRLLRKIARGSTSVMYEATDMRSHNRVALKVMRIQRDEKLERDRIRHWLHEAEVVAQLDHANIVKIHDAEMHGELVHIWRDIDQDPDISCAMIRGAGKGFSAGGDMELVEEMIADHHALVRVWKEARDMVYNIINCSKPVVSHKLFRITNLVESPYPIVRQESGLLLPLLRM